MVITIEEKIVILPLVCDRFVANKINGKSFDDIHELEDAIRTAYSEKEKDEWEKENVNIEDLIDELGVYGIDEFICRLNDEIYPTDMWVARVFIKS